MEKDSSLSPAVVCPVLALLEERTRIFISQPNVDQAIRTRRNAILSHDLVTKCDKCHGNFSGLITVQPDPVSDPQNPGYDWNVYATKISKGKWCGTLVLGEDVKPHGVDKKDITTIVYKAMPKK